MIKLWRLQINATDGTCQKIYKCAVDPEWVAMAYDIDAPPDMAEFLVKLNSDFPPRIFVLTTRTGSNLVCIGTSEGYVDATAGAEYGSMATEYPEA